MTFQDRLTSEGRTWTVGFVAHISGLPYLFGNFPAPSSWLTSGKVTWDSEDYDWSPTLVVPDNWGKLARKLQPKAGRGQGAQLDVSFSLPSTAGAPPERRLWLDLPLTARRRQGGLATDLVTPFDADETSTMSVTHNPWSPTTDDIILYAGLETIVVTGGLLSTSTSLVNLTRSAFKSQRIFADPSAVSSDYGGTGLPVMPVADYPLVWEGRILRLWAVLGKRQVIRDPHAYSDFEPIDGAFDDANQYRLHTGRVDYLKEGGDSLEVTIPTSSLERAARGPVSENFPTMIAGARLDSNGMPKEFALHGNNCWLHFDIAGSNSGYVTFTVLDANNLTVGDTLTIGPDTWTFDTSSAPNQIDIKTSRVSQAIEIENRILADSSLQLFSWRVDGRVILMTYDTAGGSDPPGDLGIEITTAFSPSFVCNSTDMSGQTRYAGLSQRLLRSTGDDGEPPYEEVPTEEVYTLSELRTYIRDTLQAVLGGGSRVVAGFIPQGNNKLHLSITATPVELYKDITLTIHTRWGRYDSVLRDLGFTADTYVCSPGVFKTGAGTKKTQWYIEAEKAVPVFRWPASSQITPDCLCVHRVGSSWNENGFSPLNRYWEDDDGNLIDAHFLLEDAALITATIWDIYDTTGRLLRNIRLAVGDEGSDSDKEEVFIAAKATKRKEQEIVRVPAFPKTSVPRMWLYALLSGTGLGINHPDYDVGWPGLGYGLPSDLVDVTSFENASSKKGMLRSSWIWRPGDDDDDLFDDELVLTQHQMVARDQIKLIEIGPTLEADSSSPWVLNESALITNTEDARGVGFDRRENRIVNQLIAEAGYDPAFNEYSTEIINRQLDSETLYSGKTPVKVAIRGFRSVTEGDAVVRAAAQRLFGNYSWPYAVIEVEIGAPWGWLIEIGDEATLTVPTLPSLDAPARGVTALDCRVFAVAPDLATSSPSFNRVTLIAKVFDRGRFSRIPPAMRLRTHQSGDFWYVWDHKYSDSDEPRDIERFSPGEKVRIYDLRNGNDVGTTTLASITLSGSADDSYVEFVTSPSTSSPDDRYIVTWDDYEENYGTSSRFIHFATYADGLFNGTDYDEPFMWL